ncbi:ion transport peptide-like [Nephila pilipes]|uniref:Ion transport peptide-like n=1 Tax=Nephila pilipes TaxID=299642 RepID=A0A8X6IND6_NEPPI|nr:ion transport peptide-like [Nephila pilipes]
MSGNAERDIKRGFVDIGCMGTYDKAKFHRLERLCEECYQLYRRPIVYTTCRSNCFGNDYFTHCVDTLLLHNQQKSLAAMVNDLNGRRRSNCFGNDYFTHCVDTLCFNQQKSLAAMVNDLNGEEELRIFRGKKMKIQHILLLTFIIAGLFSVSLSKTCSKGRCILSCLFKNQPAESPCDCDCSAVLKSKEGLMQKVKGIYEKVKEVLKKMKEGKASN